MTFKSSISLTEEQAAFAKSLVETGRYASLSAVLQQGLDLLKQENERREMETEALKVLLERRRQGRFLSGEEMDQRIQGIAEERRKQRGL
ncbi:MAG: type II toxin-antitoxin system ParD family antitoxin [Aquisalinus sp.]|nr:type II toxin-antitoxin system ParD family antitoxin [Aquisalinus sp.]